MLGMGVTLGLNRLASQVCCPQWCEQTEWGTHAVADEKGNSVFMDLVEHCHVWWIPSFKGVQKVGLYQLLWSLTHSSYYGASCHVMLCEHTADTIESCSPEPICPYGRNP